MADTENGRTLMWVTAGASDKCDGCGKRVEAWAYVLTGINSCCDNCYRQLCRECVEAAYMEMVKLDD